MQNKIDRPIHTRTHTLSHASGSPIATTLQEKAVLQPIFLHFSPGASEFILLAAQKDRFSAFNCSFSVKLTHFTLACASALFFVFLLQLV